MSTLAAFSYAYGEPQAKATIRKEVADFIVEEVLKVLPDGAGEHIWLHVEKRGQNTDFVARQLARWAGVQVRKVSYAGLKDRHAVTRQWYSIHLPGKKELDLNTLDIEGIDVLTMQRHSQKLRPEVLLANRFVLKLRDISAPDDLAQRWQQIVQGGVPNYFGEQRFGHDGGNIAAAKTMFAGEWVNDRHLRGLYLSAARSWIFNKVVDARIRQQVLNTPIAGDLLQLAGSRSLLPFNGEQEFIDRVQQRDLLITGPLWGEDGMQPEQSAGTLEANVAATEIELAQGLIKQRLKHARRPLLLFPEAANLTWHGEDAELSFMLGSGAFATSVLRELAWITDHAQQERKHAYSGE